MNTFSRVIPYLIILNKCLCFMFACYVFLIRYFYLEQTEVSKFKSSSITILAVLLQLNYCTRMKLNIEVCNLHIIVCPSSEFHDVRRIWRSRLVEIKNIFSSFIEVMDVMEPISRRFHTSVLYSWSAFAINIATKFSLYHFTIDRNRKSENRWEKALLTLNYIFIKIMYGTRKKDAIF